MCGSTDDGMNNSTCTELDKLIIIQNSTPHRFTSTVARCSVVIVVAGFTDVMYSY